jgi:hypothetical protein
MVAELISFKVSGSTKKTEAFLQKMSKGSLFNSLDSSAREGVSALIAGTPVDSGLAADSWGYEIERSKSETIIKWTNNDVENGFPVAIMLQYGHGTGTGGYVQGRDYINPAMKPVFDRIANQVWKAVTSA